MNSTYRWRKTLSLTESCNTNINFKPVKVAGSKSGMKAIVSEGISHINLAKLIKCFKGELHD